MHVCRDVSALLYTTRTVKFNNDLFHYGVAFFFFFVDVESHTNTLIHMSFNSIGSYSLLLFLLLYRIFKSFLLFSIVVGSTMNMISIFSSLFPVFHLLHKRFSFLIKIYDLSFHFHVL